MQISIAEKYQWKLLSKLKIALPKQKGIKEESYFKRKFSLEALIFLRGLLANQCSVARVQS
jgi:hypothetical protein